MALTIAPTVAIPAEGLVLTERSGVVGIMRWGALGLLLSALSSLLGGVWDIQWHEDVGPDTFFTAPHLFLYAGAAGAGLISLAVVLLSTWSVQKGGEAPGLGLISLFRGAIWAPAGFLVAGAGSAFYLLFGLYDLWWHSLYGFDAVLDSPPHTGLGLADLTMLSGCVVAFAALVAMRKRISARIGWPEAGLATALAIVLINSASWQIGFAGAVGDLVDGQLLFVAALFGLAILAGISVARRPGMATLIGLAFTLLCAGGWLFSAWATPVYAAALGLFPRETAFGFPRIVALLPVFVLPAAGLIDLTLAAARRLGWPVHRAVMLAAGVGMALLVVLEGVFPRGVFSLPSVESVLATAIAAAVLGAVGGWAGWKLGVVLRRLAGAAPESGTLRSTSRGHAVRPLAGAIMAFVTLALPIGVAAHGGGPVTIVHTEYVDVGPYPMAVEFSEWPLRAERSLDIVFHPDDRLGDVLDAGIAGKGGTVTLIAPSGAEEERMLARHPRLREFWGLDIIALPEEGVWTLRLDVAGVEGSGTGSVPVAVGPRPGPPVLVGWLLPLAVGGTMIAAVVAAWRKVRPARDPETWAWA